jgi:hypothetical protein
MQKQIAKASKKKSLKIMTIENQYSTRSYSLAKNVLGSYVMIK